MAQTSSDERLVLAHSRLYQQTTDRVAKWATEYWSSLGSWRDEDIEKFVARVVPVIQAGQKQVADLTNSYLSGIARLNGVAAGEAVYLPLAELRGVTLDEVYRRPAVSTYSALSEGKTLSEAVAIGRNRLDATVRLDTQMAQVRTSHARLSTDKRVNGYQRILGIGEVCLLCSLASTQRYSRGNLMPIHARCKCTVAPIYGGSPIGQVINEKRYTEINTAIADAKERGVTLRSVEVREHGEYGPVLTWKGQSFDGPADVT